MCKAICVWTLIQYLKYIPIHSLTLKCIRYAHFVLFIKSSFSPVVKMTSKTNQSVHTSYYIPSHFLWFKSSLRNSFQRKSFPHLMYCYLCSQTLLLSKNLGWIIMQDNIKLQSIYSTVCQVINGSYSVWTLQNFWFAVFQFTIAIVSRGFTISNLDVLEQR